MGNKVLSHPRVILTEDIVLHFKASDLVRDVKPIIDEWQNKGAELSLDREEFQRTFDVVVDNEQQFDSFDTERKGVVDAYEVLMIYILPSHGILRDKIETAFSIFEFNGCRGAVGSINFDEAMIMFNAAASGVHKVCSDAIRIQESEINFLVNSVFEFYRVLPSERITRAQFRDWVLTDSSPYSFVLLFHNALGFSDIRDKVQGKSLEQGTIFQMIGDGAIAVPPEDIMENAEFATLLEDPSEVELRSLVDMMSENLPSEDQGLVSSDRFHAVLRPWNIFNEMDLDRNHHLDEKELDILLWFHLRIKPGHDFVRQFVNLVDTDKNGSVSRIEWVKAIREADNVTRLAHAAYRQNELNPEGSSNGLATGGAAPRVRRSVPLGPC